TGQASGEIEIVAPKSRTLCAISLGVSRAGTQVITRALIRDVSARLTLEADVRRVTDLAVRQDYLARIGQLAAHGGHEINNPLTCLKLNVGEMRRHFDGTAAAEGDPLGGDEMLSMTQEATDAVERIERIVHALKGVADDRSDDEVLFDPLDAAR